MTYTFTCPQCGQQHEELPAIGFQYPQEYRDLSDDEKSQYSAKYTPDWCEIHYPDQSDYFIRVWFELPIIDDCQTLQYGVWVTVSKENFKKYQANNGTSEEYFAWYPCHLAPYEFEQIPVKAITQTDNSRPNIYFKPDFPHDLVRDFYHGISKEEAMRRIEAAMS